MEELIADTPVGADGGRHLLYVRADFFTQVGNLVDEADLHGEECICGILGKLGRLAAHEDHRRIAQAQRLVNTLHCRLRTRLVHAHQDTVRMGEVLDCRALSQKLRVGANREVGIGAQFAQTPLDFPAGADGNRRFCRHDGEPGQMRRDLRDRLIHVTEVGVTVAPAHRRADRKKDEVRVAHRTRDFGGEFQPARAHIAFDKFFKTRLIYRHAPGENAADFIFVLVYAMDVPAKIGETGRGHEPDVARPNHADLQTHSPDGYAGASPSLCARDGWRCP